MCEAMRIATKTIPACAAISLHQMLRTTLKESPFPGLPLGKGQEMIYEYERACKEAGLSEEKIKEIRRMFDAEKKRLKRRKIAKEKSEWGYFSIDGELFKTERDQGTMDIPDPNTNVERDVIEQCEMEQLRELLNALAPEDKRFLMDYYQGEYGEKMVLAEKYGMTIQQANYRKNKLLERLRKDFEV